MNSAINDQLSANLFNNGYSEDKLRFYIYTGQFMTNINKTIDDHCIYNEIIRHFTIDWYKQICLLSKLSTTIDTNVDNWLIPRSLLQSF